MGDQAAHEAQLEAWRAVSAGWERRRDVVWEATQGVSRHMLELLAPQPGEEVLEVAAGPGDTGFLAAQGVAPGGRLVSSDAVPGMVAAARRRAAELGIDNVEFVVADATDLTLPDRSFDGVLCRFGVMLVPDCDAAAREIRRVLRPGGRAVIAVWAEPERNPWVSAVSRSALRLGLIEAPAPDAAGPFRLGAPGRLRAVLERAELAVTREDEVEVVWRAPSLDAWWEISLDTSRTVAVLAERLTPTELARVRDGAEEQLAGFADADGALAVPGVVRVALATA